MHATYSERILEVRGVEQRGVAGEGDEKVRHVRSDVEEESVAEVGECVDLTDVAVRAEVVGIPGVGGARGVLRNGVEHLHRIEGQGPSGQRRLPVQ